MDRKMREKLSEAVLGDKYALDSTLNWLRENIPQERRYDRSVISISLYAYSLFSHLGARV